MADVVALVNDLFFQSKLAETARLAGVELKTTTTNEALLREAGENPGATVLLDLNARSKPLDTLPALRGKQAAPGQTGGEGRRVIAFLSHVQTELAERARAAGCDEVMPRSKFTQELPRILREAKSK
jgi:DNA-binding NarL/FixJ family response regulator